MEQRILDEAIAHEREVAENHRKSAKYAKDRFSTEGMQELYRQNSIKEAEKHEQLVAWLEELKAYRETGHTPQMVNDIVKSEKQAHKDAVHNALLVDDTYNKVKQASDLLEKAVEEIENMYGRETALTEEIRLFIDKESETE